MHAAPISSHPEGRADPEGLACPLAILNAVRPPKKVCMANAGTNEGVGLISLSRRRYVATASP